MLWQWTGRTAEIRWGHRLAAQLTHWTLSSGQHEADAPVERRFAGAILEVNAFAIHQTPLTLVIPRAVPIRWPILSLDVGSTHVRALLGEMERTRHVEVRAAGE